MLSWISAKLCLPHCWFLFISINQLIVPLALVFIHVNQVIDSCEATGNQSVLARPTGAGPHPGVANRAPGGGNPTLIYILTNVSRRRCF